MIRFASLSLVALSALAGATIAARAADPVAVAFDEPGICANASVLGTIAGRFRHQVTHVPNLPDVAIADFQRISETLHKPQIYDERPIDRRYCHARADMSDGRSHDVWYVIERPAGFAGIGSNVEFCVSGFDRWNVYDGRCRVLRPALW
jgi:capsid protein